MGDEKVTPVVLSQHIFDNLPSTFPNRDATQVITMPMPWSHRIERNRSPNEKQAPLRVLIYGHGGPVARDLCEAILATCCAPFPIEVIHLGMNTNLVDHFPFATNLSPNRMMPRDQMVDAAKLGDVLLYPYRPDQYQLCSSLAPYEAIWLGLPIIGVANKQLKQISTVSNGAARTFSGIHDLVKHLLLLQSNPRQLNDWIDTCEGQRANLIAHLQSNHCEL